MSKSRAEVRELKDGAVNSPEYVIAHAARQKQRGRQPSISYRGVKNPSEALKLARTDYAEAPTTRYSPRPIGANWLVCFVCGDAKDGFSSINRETGEPEGDPVPSALTEDGVSYIGRYNSAQPDMAAFVDGKEDGERVVGMFAAQNAVAALDFRPEEPNWVQVKVGACDDHLPNLEHLRDLATEAGGQINPAIISASLQPAEA